MTVFESMRVVYFLFTFEFDPLSSVFTTFFLYGCIDKNLQGSASCKSQDVEQHCSSSCSSFLAVPTARHLVRCIQPGLDC